MKRFGYLAVFLAILLGLIIPVVYTQKVSGNGRPGPEAAINPTGNISPAENTAVKAPPEADESQKEITPERPPQETNTGQAETKAAAVTGSSGSPPKDTLSSNTGFSAPGPAGSSGSAPVLPEDNTCQVGIAVVGMQGEMLYGPATVTISEDNKWGLTVLGALDATGLKYNMSPAYGKLVLGIAGQQNKGMCGWMYKVNNETPMVAAGEKEVKPGDKIIWWYSEKINNPGPDWESLCGSPNRNY